MLVDILGSGLPVCRQCPPPAGGSRDSAEAKNAKRKDLTPYLILYYNSIMPDDTDTSEEASASSAPQDGGAKLTAGLLVGQQSPLREILPK